MRLVLHAQAGREAAKVLVFVQRMSRIFFRIYYILYSVVNLNICSAKLTFSFPLRPWRSL